jgi:hypothetical protein
MVEFCHLKKKALSEVFGRTKFHKKKDLEKKILRKVITITRSIFMIMSNN